MLAQGFTPLPAPRIQPSIVTVNPDADRPIETAETAETAAQSYCVIPLTELGARDLIRVHFPTEAKLPTKYEHSWRTRAGASGKTVLTEFDHLEPSKSTVGTAAGNEYHPGVRQSQVLKDLQLSVDRDERFELSDDIKTLFPSRFAESEFDLFRNRDDGPRMWQLHAYDVGGFFTRHTDGQKEASHFGTLLLFPPAQFSAAMPRGHDAAIKMKRLLAQPPTFEPGFAGGALILYPRGKMPVRLETAAFKCWTLVAFHLDVAHECTPVAAGRRFVFKTELDLPRTGYFDNDVTATAADRAPVPLAEGTREYRKKIDELERKIAKYQAIIAALESNQLTPRVQKILRQIDTYDDNVMVALTTPTVIAKPSALVGEEAQLWNAVLDRWPYSTLAIIEVRHNAGDGTDRGRDEFYVNEDKIPCSVIPFRNPNRAAPGDLISSDSDYNDNTYDTINRYRVIAVCVQKRRPGQTDDEDDDSNDKAGDKDDADTTDDTKELDGVEELDE
jgi:hypothetical protein